MTDEKERLSRPYRIKPIDDDASVEDDNFDKDAAYEAWQDEATAGAAGVLRKYGVVVVLLVFSLIAAFFLYNAMRPKTETIHISQTTELGSRIDTLELRLTRLEEQIAQGNEANTQNMQTKILDRLSDRVGRLEVSFETWMEEVTAKMEIIPPKPAAKKSTPSTAKKPAAPKKKQEKIKKKEKKVAAGETRVRYHTVQQAETLYRISLRYGVSVGRLKELNGLSGNTINPGQKLRVSP
jgi:LysM repeat protein